MKKIKCLFGFHNFYEKETVIYLKNFYSSKVEYYYLGNIEICKNCNKKIVPEFSEMKNISKYDAEMFLKKKKRKEKLKNINEQSISTNNKF